MKKVLCIFTNLNHYLNLLIAFAVDEKSKVIGKVLAGIFLIGNFATQAVFAENKGPQNNKSVIGKGATKTKKIVFKQVPSIKRGEFTYFYDGDYHIFTTQKIDNIAYSHHCFKSKKPDCEAIRFSELNNKIVKLTNPEMTNYAAAYCAEIYGKNMVTFDHEKKEYNFCRFKDGSLVASWALFKAKNPKISVDYK